MLHRELRTAWLEIDLDTFDRNLKSIFRRIGSRKLIGVVKGDAYGHGAVQISRVLLRNGASHLAVATLDEALELRDADIHAPILMLGLTADECAEYVVRDNVIPLISSKESAVVLSKHAVRQKKDVHVFIAVDTGMGRIGFLPVEKSADELVDVLALPGIKLEGIMSHLSSADMDGLDYSYRQIGQFEGFCKMLEDKGIAIPLRSLANSPALYRLDEYLYDAVRPGSMIYGFYPDNVGDEQKRKIPVSPVMSVKAKIIYIKTVPPGTAISYGRKFVTKRESVIATIPLGYADGLTRLLQGGRLHVLVRESRAPVLGTICMDQCMIDVTDIPGIKIGDEVVVMGRQGGERILPDELCGISGLCSGELWYHFSQRLPRVFCGKENFG